MIGDTELVDIISENLKKEIKVRTNSAPCYQELYKPPHLRLSALSSRSNLLTATRVHTNAKDQMTKKSREKKRVPKLISDAEDDFCTVIFVGQVKPKEAQLRQVRRLARRGGIEEPEWSEARVAQRAATVKANEQLKRTEITNKQTLFAAFRTAYQEYKGAKTAYMLFSKEIRASVVAENPGFKFGPIGKEIAERWKVLSADEKRIFKDRCEAFKNDMANKLREAQAAGVNKFKMTSSTVSQLKRSSKQATALDRAIPISPSSVQSAKAHAPQYNDKLSECNYEPREGTQGERQCGRGGGSGGSGGGNGGGSDSGSGSGGNDGGYDNGDGSKENGDEDSLEENSLKKRKAASQAKQGKIALSDFEKCPKLLKIVQRKPAVATDSKSDLESDSGCESEMDDDDDEDLDESMPPSWLKVPVAIRDRIMEVFWVQYSAKVRF